MKHLDKLNNEHMVRSVVVDMPNIGTRETWSWPGVPSMGGRHKTRVPPHLPSSSALVPASLLQRDVAVVSRLSS